MKYVVTSICIKRNGPLSVEIITLDTGDITREETIDTETNEVFYGLTEPYEIEDRYEAYWNRLNGGYKNHQIVKVLNVLEASH